MADDAQLNAVSQADVETIHAVGQHLENLKKKIYRALSSDQGEWSFVLANESIYSLLAWRVQEKKVDYETLAALVQDVIREVDHFDVLISNLTSFYSQASRSLHLDRKRFDLRGLLEEVADLFEPSATEKGIDFRLLLPDSAPVEADRDKLRRAIVNVVANAVKYSFPASGSGNRYISIFCRRHSTQGAWLVSVSSFGVGVLDEERGSVFEYGYRGKLAKKTGVRGTGIGLAEVKRIVEAHGGKVSIRSSQKGGEGFRTEVELTFLGGAAFL